MISNIYATAITIRAKGVLFIGNSGAGKSDLALRLISEYGAKLIADDRVDISVTNQQIFATSPDNIKGLLEVRGVGIVKIDSLAQSSQIDLVVKLTNEHIERLPEPQTYYLGGVKIPLVFLNPFECSAPAKVIAALSLL